MSRRSEGPSLIGSVGVEGEEYVDEQFEEEYAAYPNFSERSRLTFHGIRGGWSNQRVRFSDDRRFHQGAHFDASPYSPAPYRRNFSDRRQFPFDSRQGRFQGGQGRGHCPSSDQGFFGYNQNQARNSQQSSHNDKYCILCLNPNHRVHQCRFGMCNHEASFCHDCGMLHTKEVCVF